MASDFGPSGFVPPPAVAPRPRPPDRLQNVPVVGALMLVHGGLILVWALFCVFAILVGIVNVGLIGGGRDEDYFVIVAYSLFAAGALPVGVVEMVAGARVRKLRGRKLAIGALFASVFSLFCGNVFCLPLSLALLVYGLVTLFDAGVVAAFARVEAGEPPEAVLPR